MVMDLSIAISERIVVVIISIREIVSREVPSDVCVGPRS